MPVMRLKSTKAHGWKIQNCKKCIVSFQFYLISEVWYQLFTWILETEKSIKLIVMTDNLTNNTCQWEIDVLAGKQRGRLFYFSGKAAYVLPKQMNDQRFLEQLGSDIKTYTFIYFGLPERKQKLIMLFAKKREWNRTYPIHSFSLFCSIPS